MDPIIIVTSVILLREGLEAVLILSILWSIAKKARSDRLHEPIKFGAIFALMLSLFLGLFLTFLTIEFEGLGEYFFEGFMSLTAAVLVTYVVLWMSRNAAGLKSMIENKIDKASIMGGYWPVFSVSFFIVFREGIEAVLLLTVLISINLTATLMGLIVGSIVLSILAFIVIYLGIKIPLKTFFRATAVFLILIAAGLIGYGVHELIEISETLGYDLGVLSYKVWDTSWLVSESSYIGIFLKGLIGYEASPELLRVLITTSYLGITGYYLFRNMYRAGG